MLVELNRVEKHFPIGDSTFTALSQVSLSFERGEFTGIVGPSGSGKTTLLNIIGLLDTPTSGSAIVLNKSSTDLSEKESAQLRSAHLGFIFQTYNLFSVYTVFENVEFPLLLLDLPKKERKL